MTPLDNTEELRSEPELGRRALIAALATGAFAAVATTAKAQAPTAKIGTRQLRYRLLRRTSYGPISAEISKCNQMGYDAYLDYQLNYEAIDDTESEQAAAYFSSINFSERDLYKLQGDAAKDDLSEATIVRALMSKRQLYQRMVEFWTDHFNIFYDKVGVLKTVHDRDVIRKFALGNFPQMLQANTHSPATLVYLDNDPSSKESPNQNLARELMELHSIGVNGGYTQTDVINVAKCLTGWTVRLWPPYATDIGKFVFDRYVHSGGSKLVLGNTIPKSGENEGIQVVDILSKSRACGAYIGTKMCRFFLGYEPPQALVDKLADIYLSTGGEIKPMLKAVLAQENLAAAQLIVKRPFHYVIGLLRQTQAQLTYSWPVRDVLYEMGQHPFEWSPPNGYPAASGFWAPGLLPRWNFAFNLFDGQIDWIKVDRAKHFKKAELLEDVLQHINSVLYMGEMNDTVKGTLRTILGDDTSAYGHAMNAFGYAAAFPGYQEC